MYMEMFKLGGQTALVTGGGQGIGLACVEALAEAGAKVAIADYNQAIAETGRDAMKKKGADGALLRSRLRYSASMSPSARINRRARLSGRDGGAW